MMVTMLGLKCELIISFKTIFLESQDTVPLEKSF